MTEEEWKWALEPMRRQMMREATQEEREGVEQYIDSIAEPCEDCVSRRDAVNACTNGWGYDDETIKHIVENIKNLSSVTPAEKVGRWEWIQHDGNPNIGNWHCSECNRIVCGAITAVNPVYSYKYCPEYGAKMQEVEE